MRHGLILLLIFNISNSLFSQIERYHNTEDTATYIAPEDTITKPPLFGDSENDFFNYLELGFNKTNYVQYIPVNGLNVHFSFLVEKKGTVEDFKIISTDNSLVANEIQRIVSNMPNWNAGKQDGKRKNTLMVYDLLIKAETDQNKISVYKNSFNLEYTNKTNPIKYFLVAGTLLIMTMLWIVK